MPKKRGNKGSFNNKNGINKKYNHNQKGRYNYNNKYIAPHLITDDLDEDLERRDNHRNQNQNYNNKKNNHHQNKNNIYDRLDNLTVKRETKKKLVIGDNDDKEKKKLLATQLHCKLSDVPQSVFDIIVKFLQDYFTCYDTNRENLFCAYNPKVLFSMSINSSASSSHRVFKFDDYIKDSRNLKRVFATDDYSIEKRYKLIQQGQLDTIHLLKKLPPTEHDPNTFKLDNCFFTNHMLTFSVVGAFKEGLPTDKVRPLRSFTRTFVCIPNATTNMSIINEQYVIANISRQQYNNFYRVNDKKVTSNPATSSSVASSSISTSLPSTLPTDNLVPGKILTEEQKQMVQQFSLNSNLTYHYSHDCLEQSNWNFDAAAQLFIQFKSQLPPEAFKS